MARKSVLFSPGDKAELLRKAPGTGADVVVFDLEDAVNPAQKPTARETVRTVLTELDASCEICVRVNPAGLGAEDDISEVLVEARDAIDTVVVPKVSGADDVVSFRRLLEDEGLSLPILALVETASGVLNAEEIAAANDVEALAFGAEDLAADIGATRTNEGSEIVHARQHVVLAATAADVDAIDTLFTDFRDMDGLAEDATKAVQLGFDGKLAIHPDQVSVINDAFSPDEDEIDWARRVLEAEAAAEGSGVFSVDGEMIDEPLLRQARTILERAEEE